MVKEEGIFTIAEDEMICEEEIIVVAEDEVFSPISSAPTQGAQAPVSEPEDKSTNWLDTKDPEHFNDYIKEEFNRIKAPTAVSGSRSGIEQSLGQWKKLNTFISQALRTDYHGKLNSQWLDKVRDIVEKNIEALERMLDGYAQMAKDKKMRRRADEEAELVKEATTPKFSGLQTNVTLFETAIMRILINSTVSGGKDIEETYEALKEKYDFSPREELALFQGLSDMGYPVFKDRMMIGESDNDPSKPDYVGEWQSQYYS